MLLIISLFPFHGALYQPISSININIILGGGDDDDEEEDDDDGEAVVEVAVVVFAIIKVLHDTVTRNRSFTIIMKTNEKKTRTCC